VLMLVLDSFVTITITIEQEQEQERETTRSTIVW
jgi:hypothetical protein